MKKTSVIYRLTGKTLTEAIMYMVTPALAVTTVLVYAGAYSG